MTLEKLFKLQEHKLDIKEKKVKKRKVISQSMRTMTTIVPQMRTFHKAIKQVTDSLTETFVKQFSLVKCDLVRQKDSEIESLKTELKWTKTKCKITEGRITPAEKQIQDIPEELMQLKARTMKPNLVFYNIPEEMNQRSDLEDTVKIVKMK